MEWFLIGISIDISSRKKIPWPSSQCFRSGLVSVSALIWLAGSGSRRTKMTPKIERREEISSVEVLDVLF